jgi:hypothetical protein
MQSVENRVQRYGIDAHRERKLWSGTRLRLASTVDCEPGAGEQASNFVPEFVPFIRSRLLRA